MDIIVSVPRLARPFARGGNINHFKAHTLRVTMI